MHILRCMGSKFWVKFQRAPLKFHTKFWTHTPQNMHFTFFNICLWVTISLNCNAISLSETVPIAVITGTLQVIKKTEIIGKHKIRKFLSKKTKHCYICKICVVCLVRFSNEQKIEMGEIFVYLLHNRRRNVIHVSIQMGNISQTIFPRNSDSMYYWF